MATTSGRFLYAVASAAESPNPEGVDTSPTSTPFWAPNISLNGPANLILPAGPNVMLVQVQAVLLAVRLTVLVENYQMNQASAGFMDPSDQSYGLSLNGPITINGVFIEACPMH
jgi:hypothetical protein